MAKAGGEDESAKNNFTAHGLRLMKMNSNMICTVSMVILWIGTFGMIGGIILKTRDGRSALDTNHHTIWRNTADESLFDLGIIAGACASLDLAKQHKDPRDLVLVNKRAREILRDRGYEADWFKQP